MKSTQLEEPGAEAKAAADTVTHLFANGSLQQLGLLLPRLLSRQVELKTETA